jgi:hypothetical protein
MPCWKSRLQAHVISQWLSPVPIISLALHDDDNLARPVLSSIDQILRSINDSIPNQIPTARNFPALSLARPEHHPSCHPPLLHRHHRKVPQPASHAQKDCGERTKTNIPKNPRKRKANGRPAATSRSVAAAATPAQNKDGETRKATRNRLAIVHSSRLPRCQGRKKRSEPGVARCHTLAALVAFLPSLCRA